MDMTMKFDARFVLPVVAIAALGACSKKTDTAAPFATPSLSMNHTRAALGSPVELTYRFKIEAAAQPLTKNYRVMVHFLDANEEMMWTDDHLPPVPTSQWKPGQTVEYNRTLFIPLYPYVGDANVEVGLYETGSDERVPMAGETRGHRAYRVAKMQLLPQTENVFLMYQDGWNAPESATGNSAIEWQWTKKDATLKFRNPKRAAMFYLHADGQPAAFDAPQVATVFLGTQQIDTFTITNDELFIRKVPITPQQFGSEDMVQIRISVDKTFVPALRTPGNRDPRELGLRIFHAYVEPQ
jgi:hypothetical protein